MNTLTLYVSNVAVNFAHRNKLELRLTLYSDIMDNITICMAYTNSKDMYGKMISTSNFFTNESSDGVFNEIKSWIDSLLVVNYIKPKYPLNVTLDFVKMLADVDGFDCNVNIKVE